MVKMAHDDNLKKEVRRLYIFDKLSLANCAVMANVSYQTAMRWKKQAKEMGDDWDKVKTAHTLAGGDLEEIGQQILTDFLVQFKSTMDAIRNDKNLTPTERVELLTSLSDSYNKAVSANKKIMPETSELATAMKVLEKLAGFIRDNKPELLQEFVNILEPFGEVLQKELK